MDGLGLFGTINHEDALVKDIYLSEPNMIASDRAYVGVLVGILESGTVTGCKVNGGKLSAYRSGGGLIGLSRGDVYNCQSSCSVIGENRLGGLIGYNRGSVSESSASGNVSGNYCLGGLIGFCYGTTDIMKCSASGNVTVSDSGNGGNMGGLVGEVVGCNIMLSKSEGNVTGVYSIGGFVGKTSSTATIIGCCSFGNAEGIGNDVGGFVGLNYGEISDCYSQGNASGPLCTGGFAGKCYSMNSEIINCYSTGQVLGQEEYGGFAGRDIGEFHGCFWDIQSSGMTESYGGSPLNSSEMFLSEYFRLSGWDFETPVWTICNELDYPRLAWEDRPCLKYGGGTGIANDPYQIWTPEQMQKIGQHPVDWQMHFRLMADIDLSAYDGAGGREAFNVIGTQESPFRGAFDGRGHAILNYTRVGAVSFWGVGVFDYCDGVEILDVRFVNPQIDTDYGGAVITRRLVSGIIRNCHIEGGSITATSYSGCLVGVNMGTITECSSSCAISGDDFVGGIVGDNRGIIESCYATGDVAGGGQVGGLAGGTGNSFGGIGDVSNCYATGSVVVTLQYGGGLIGANMGGAISWSYSTGMVSGPDYFGGLIGGIFSGACSNCFWDIETSGQTESAGGIGMAWDDMQTRSTFTDAGWDFVGEGVNGVEDVWRMCLDGVDYPRLSWGYSRGGDFACADGVGIEDMVYLAGRWLMEDEVAGAADADGDGRVDMRDFGVMFGNLVE